MCLKIQLKQVKLVARAGDIGPLRQEACDGEQGSRTGAGQHTRMLGNRTWVVGGRGVAQPASEHRDEKDVGGFAQDRGPPRACH